MNEILWIVMCGIAVWVSWRVVIMTGALNPLMAMGFAMLLMIAGPFGLVYATEWLSDQGDPYSLTELMGKFQIVAPIAFAFVGVLLSLMLERLSLPRTA